MARYSSKAALRILDEWIDEDANDSDNSEGSDAASSDVEDVLEIDSLVLTDDESDGAADSDDDIHVDSNSIEENEPMDTVTDAVNAVAAGSGRVQENTGEFYSSKDGNVWSDVAPVVGRRRAQDVVRVTPGPKNHARPETVDGAVFLFCDELFMKIVVDSTNKEMTRAFTEGSRLHDLMLLDISEAKAFLGLLILIGVLRGRREPLQQLWDDKWGRPIFRATMGINRFKTILRYMRFDDKETRAERRVADKLAAIRELFEHFVNSCRTYYELSPCTTVDEQLSPFRGRCPFRMYIKSKPAKYGMKLWVLCDSETAYCGNAQVYTGKEGNVPEKGQGARVVKDLVTYIYNTGRNITMDNFFTDVELADHLLTQKLTVVGTVRKNKACLPAELLETGRDVQSSIFLFTKDMTLTSYVPKANKCVVLLSTMHHDGAVDKDPGSS
jgi:hypothetical protein